MARTVPTGADVERFAYGAGMIAATPAARHQYLDFDLAADAAYEDFKKAVNIKVFFAETNATTRYYDTQGGRLVQIPPYFTITAIHVGFSHETSSEAQTDITDYVKFPQGDPPFTLLEFAEWHSAGPQRVGVTGRRGWSNDFPADAFTAILGQALGVHLAPQIIAGINSGAITWREGDVSEGYGSGGAFSGSREAWKRNWEDVTRPMPLGYRQVYVYGAGRL